MAATKSPAFAALSTAGNSMSMATASTCRRRRQTQVIGNECASRPTRRASGVSSSGPTWAPRIPPRSCRSWISRACRPHTAWSARSCRNATGRSRSRAGLTRRISRSCTCRRPGSSSATRPARSRRPTPTSSAWPGCATIRSRNSRSSRTHRASSPAPRARPAAPICTGASASSCCPTTAWRPTRWPAKTTRARPGYRSMTPRAGSIAMRGIRIVR